MKKGFSIIELLVVLLILSLTTVLMASGLENTWRNFSRLDARDLTVSAAQLPSTWFRQSVEGAVLYHPDKSVFSGSSLEFEFITFNLPGSQKHQPSLMTWQIHLAANKNALRFSSEKDQWHTILALEPGSTFEYQHEGEWQTEFKPTRGRLPEAIRLVSDGLPVFQAVPQRPIEADIPAEYPVFGIYEF